MFTSSRLESGYGVTNFDVFVNDNFVGSIESAGRGESKVSVLEIENSSVFHRDGENNIFMVYNEPGGFNELTQVWWVNVICKAGEPPPGPTGRSMVISNTEWENVLSVVPVHLPLIVADRLDGNVRKFIEDYRPDQIYTLGFDSGLENSFSIRPEDVSGLFFPNATEALFADERDGAVLASQMAYYLGFPLLFDKQIWEHGNLTDISGMTIQEIQKMYVDEVKKRGENIDYLVLTNLENESSLLAGRLAGMRRGYIVPLKIQGIEYGKGLPDVNEENHVYDFFQSIAESADILAGEGMFHNTSEYRKGGEIYLGIVGDEYSVPHLLFNDPGLEVIYDKDGGLLYTDIFYGDLNQDGYMDLSTGRLRGDLTSISLQLERAWLPKGEDAVLIGQYRHRKYLEAMLQGGGMTQAYMAQWAFDQAGFETRRIIENRTELPFTIGLKGMYEMALHHYGMSLTGVLGSINLAWGIVEAGTNFIYAYLEHDWGRWYENVLQGNVGLPQRMEVLYPDTDFGQPRILGYFGMGDEFWIVPPDNKDGVELLTFPYIRATFLESLDFSNFLYDDHDLSADSEIGRQVLNSGGMAAASSGIVHDPYTIYYSGNYFDALKEGSSVGEAMRTAVNNVVPENVLILSDLLISKGKLPNLYFKTKYERILLGDPAYTPVEDGVPSKQDVFMVAPYNSYIAESSIVSDYVIKDRKLTVRNADDALIENGKPIVPVFVREIVLPEGADLEDVRFRGYYRRYRSLETPVIIPLDEYYPEEEVDFSGIYPEENHWFRSNELVDGKVLVRVYVPAVIYRKNGASVLSSGRLSIEYESPVEVMVRTSNIRLGLTEDIKVNVSNSGEEGIIGTLWLWVGDEKFSREVEVEPGEGVEVTFGFTPQEARDFQARVLLDSETATGFRYSNFKVWEACRIPCSRFGFWVRGLLGLWGKDRCCDFLDCLEDKQAFGKWGKHF